MLRLDPTQIRLEKRDLDWHRNRQEQRRTMQLSASPNVAKAESRKYSKRQYDGRALDEISSAPLPLSTMPRRIHRGPDTEIFSDDPVPRGSRAFWDRVLAEAGTPTRVQTAATGMATVVEPSDEFLKSTHSSKGSIESVSVDPNSESSGFRSRSFDDAAGPSSFVTPYASRSSNSTTDHGIHEEKAEQLPPPRDITQTSSLPNRLSFFSPRRKRRPDTEKSSDSMEIGHVNHSLSGSMAVDGPSDQHSSRYSDLSEVDRRALSPELDDGLYGNRRDRRTVSQAFSSSGDQPHGQDTEVSMTRPGHQNALPPPRAFGHSRNYSGARSSLYISEAAVSSSPERRPTTPTDRNPIGLEGQSLLSQPPRRPRMYRRRSQTYSFAESEALPDPDMPQMDGSSTVHAITNRIPSLSISSPPEYSVSSPGSHLSYQQPPTTPGRASDRDFPSSPLTLPPLASPYNINSPASPQETVEIRSYRSLGSMRSSHSRIPSSNSPINSSPNFVASSLQPLPQRSLSPYAAQYLPHRAHRITSSQLVLPPPFSATSRNVSYTSAYPPSSPASPHTPPPRQTSLSISPPTNQPRSPSAHHPTPTTISPPSATHPSPLRVPVYNDNISPTTQPQTPIGLPRHGIPAMHTQHAPFTAPAGRGLGRFSARAMADWQAFATPTGRGRVADGVAARGRIRDAVAGMRVRGTIARGDGDQENVGRIPEEERRARREREMGRWE